MNNLEKFNHSVSVLLNAYLNDTLVHGNCYACAVGNLVADGLCTKVVKGNPFSSNAARRLIWEDGGMYPGSDNYSFDASGWGAVFATSNNGFNGRKRQEINIKYLEAKEVQRQISSTGYSWQQLARIEKAFEFVDKRRKDKMFNGLMAVVDVLAEIHNIDLTVKEQAKSLFVCTTK